jgi:glucose/arabinose dehydrogenase
MRSAVLVAVLLALGIIAFALAIAWWPRAETEPPSADAVEEEAVAEGVPATAVVAENLAIPWDIAFLPDGEGMLATERAGRVVHIESGQTFEVEGVEHVGEGGLLGMALHPDFVENRYVYLFQTTRTDAGLRNRVVRYTYEDALTFESTIVEGLPGAAYHDGGRIEFGPPAACASGQADCHLYITLGDAGTENAAQNTESLAGSILRVEADGGIPPDNPFGNAIYSYGHRNPQGLAWDDDGRLWSTEHGRSGALSGLDEVNLIERGANYGWPDSEGDDVAEGTTGPKAHSGARDTWAPASALYLPAPSEARQAGYAGSIYFGGLRGEALYEAVLSGDEIVEVREHFKGEFGRIRSVRQGPDGFLYLTTSNRDGRGAPVTGDDRIIRVDPGQI